MAHSRRNNFYSSSTNGILPFTVFFKSSDIFKNGLKSYPGKSHLCGLAKLSLIHTRPARLQSAPLSSPGD